MNLISSIKWALLWALLIFILCALPGEDIPFDDFWDMFNLDKAIHFLLFFILTILFIDGLRTQSQFEYLVQPAKTISFVACIIYGALLELMQEILLNGRSGDALDIVANVLGTLAGVFLFHRVMKLFTSNSLSRK